MIGALSFKFMNNSKKQKNIDLNMMLPTDIASKLLRSFFFNEM